MNKESYEWNYCSLGGVIRVKIASGEDLEHLGAVWVTVLVGEPVTARHEPVRRRGAE